ncbi:MAG: DUF3426 domain-containing protein [Burkholderiales bacterium]|nr:DUF3426 domain-containing protein [Burkholderiales bacterium]
MFHVTRCPNCRTSFRVTDAHLASFEGKVRCGRCAFVFDARQHFVGESAPAAVAAPAPEVALAVAPTPAPFVEPPPAATVTPTAVHATPPAPVPTRQPSTTDVLMAEEHAYGLDSMASQLGAAAEVERDEEESLASRSLEQLAAALGDDTPPDMGHGTGMLELNLNFDADAHPENEASPHDAHWPPAQVDDLPAASPPPIEVVEDHSPEAFEAWAEAHTSVAGSEPAEADHEAVTAYDDADAVPMSVDAHGPSGDYHPILTAEDEALLRVPGGPSPWRWMWSIPAFLAILLLAGQATYHYRNELSVQLPGFRPKLERFCVLTGCRMELPARSELLRTEWSELKFAPDHPSVIQVEAILQNQATFEQALPQLELTLTDDADRIVARKVFEPRSYLAPLADGTPAPLPSGLPANGEQHIFLQLDLGALHSTGYSIAWVYPQRI